MIALNPLTNGGLLASGHAPSDDGDGYGTNKYETERNDLSVVMTSDTTKTFFDDTISYTIRMRNLGDDAVFPSMRMQLPDKTVFVSLSNPLGWVKSTPAVNESGEVVAAIRELAESDGEQVFTLVVKLDGTHAHEQLVAGTVSVASATTDYDTSNDSANVFNTVVDDGIGVPRVLTTSFDALGTLPVRSTTISVEFDQPVLGADDRTNYELRRAEAGHLLEQGDAKITPATVFYDAPSHIATLTFTVPLTADIYRLTVKDTITGLEGKLLDGDNNGNKGGDYRKDFVVDNSTSLATLTGPSGVVLDTTFDGDGRVTTPAAFASTFGESIQSVAIQSDGKTVVAGRSHNGTDFDFTLARYNVDGSLDKLFGVNGIAVQDFGIGHDFANGLALQSDGKIVVVGTSQPVLGGDQKMALARFNTNGSLDTTFGSDAEGDGVQDGIVFDTGFNARSVAIQSTGKIVVAGTRFVERTRDGVTVPDFYFSISRYDVDGVIDTAFGTGGTGTQLTVFGNIDRAYEIYDRAYGIAVHSDDTIVVAGDSLVEAMDLLGSPSFSFDFALARYDANGAPVASFGTDGKVTTPLGPHDDQAFAVAFQPDGKIVAAGTVDLTAEIAPGAFALVRYNVDGSLDTSFDGNGIQLDAFSGLRGEVRGLAIQKDGKIVAAGSGQSSSGDVTFAFARYKTDGSLDASFGSGGTLSADFGTPGELIPHAAAQSVALQEDGKIVAAGDSGGLGGPGSAEFALLRLEELPGYKFDIDTSEDGYGQLLQGSDNAFDGLNRLVVGGSLFASTGSATFGAERRTLITPTKLINGLNVHREIYVPASGRDSFARTIDVLQNPTDADITTSVMIVGNLGSDAATRVFATSDNHWIGTDDVDGGGTPAILHYIHTCGLKPTSVQVVEDNIVWTYDVTVAAGETINLAHLTILAANRLNAMASASTLVSPSGLLRGLAAESLPGTIANFVANTSPVADSANASGPKNANIVGSLTATDTDAGDTLTYILVSGPANGTVVITGNQFVYSPTPNFVGPDSFEFKVNDGCVDSNIATISISVFDVNSPPVASDVSLSGSEDTPLSGALVARDSDSATLTYSIVASPSHGSVQLVDSGPQFTYTPTAHYNGTDSFTFKANDGQANSNVATVNIALAAVNDAPINTLPSSPLATSEDTPLLLSAFRVTDVDAGTENIEVTLSVVNGKLGVSSIGVTLDPNDGSSSSVKITGSVDAINSVLTTGVTYTPNKDFHGEDTLTIITSDLGQSGAGGALTDTDAVVITVTPVNDAPVAVDGSTTGDQDSAAQGTVMASDVDLDALTYSVVSGPSHGMFETFDETTGQFTYVPNAGFVGIDSFTFRAKDGSLFSNTATYTIEVVASNIPFPRNVVPNAQTTQEDTPLEFPSGSIGVEVVNGMSTEVVVELKLSVLHGTINVPVRDGLTVMGNNSASATVTGPITFVTLALLGGRITYTPDPDYDGYDGPDALTMVSKVVISGRTDTDTVAITVTPVNDGPVNSLPAELETLEDTPLVIGNIGIADVDARNDVMNVTLSITHGTLSVPASAGVTVVTSPSIDGAPFSLRLTGTLTAINAALIFGVTYTPNENFNGEVSLTMVTEDGAGATATDTSVIFVSPVNDPPTDLLISASNINENVPADTVVGIFSTTDADVGDSHTYSLVAGDTDSFTVAGNQLKISVSPDFEAQSSYSIRVRTTDASGLTFDRTFSIAVNDLIEPPTTVGPFRFDLNSTVSPTAPGFKGIGSGAVNFYTPARGVGWQIASGTFDRTIPTDLLRDGHFGRDNTFLVDLPNGSYVVNVTMGDSAAPRDFVDVYAEGVLKLHNVTVLVGQRVHRSFPVTVSDGQLTLRFKDNGGDIYFSVNAIEIYRSQGVITLTDATGDGTVISGSGATPGSSVTVSTFLGGIAPSTVDASPNYAGVQVMANPSGAFSFNITPPSASGTATIHAEEVSGEKAGSLMVSFPGLGPAVQIIDDDGNGTAVPGFTHATFTGFSGQGFQNDVLFTAGDNTGDTATWTFSVLPGGLYRVSATWTPFSNRALDAPYTISGVTGGPVTVDINQRVPPNNQAYTFVNDGGKFFADLGVGATYVAMGSTLTISLSDDVTASFAPNDYVIADAVRVERLSVSNRLRFMAAGNVIDLTTIPAGKLLGIQTLDFGSGGGNMLKLDAARVQEMVGSGGMLELLTGATDTVEFGAGWQVTGTTVRDNQFFRVLEQAGVQIEIAGTRPWQNPLRALDVNRDGTISPVDALIVINELNTPRFSDLNHALRDPKTLAATEIFSVDVDGENSVAPIDVLLVFNHLNAPFGNGEGHALSPVIVKDQQSFAGGEPRWLPFGPVTERSNDDTAPSTSPRGKLHAGDAERSVERPFFSERVAASNAVSSANRRRLFDDSSVHELWEMTPLEELFERLHDSHLATSFEA